MKIVLAPNALKGSLSAIKAAAAMEKGCRAACAEAEIRAIPVSDGGDGLVEVLLKALGGDRRNERVTGPLGGEVAAEYALLPDGRTAVLEMASASGLALVPEDKRDPAVTTTRGTGELIRTALDHGARIFLLGIGGSATNDGGAGMAAVLGARFLNRHGQAFLPVGCTLREIEKLDLSGLDPRIRESDIRVACDVENPLLGPTGATRVYAPQKGASVEGVEALEAGLAHLADRIESDLGIRVRPLPGGGAAGGLGAGLVAFLGAKLTRGADTVLALVGLSEHLEGADLAITAEGRLDSQTAFGKAPAAVAALARRQGVPCIVLAGSVACEAAALREAGFVAALSICPGPVALADALANASTYLCQTTEEAVRLFLAGGRLAWASSKR
ncbi:MAG: glycerate kinase [Planctomycetota bacterium]